LKKGEGEERMERMGDCGLKRREGWDGWDRQTVTGAWKTLTPTLSRGERGKRRSPGARGGRDDLPEREEECRAFQAVQPRKVPLRSIPVQL